MESYSSIKKNKIMPFAATWIELETLILSEVERESQIPYDITYNGNLIYCRNEPFHRKENHGHGEQIGGCQAGGGGSGNDWEISIKRCKLLPLERIRKRSCCIALRTLSLMMEHDNVRRKNVYIYL